MGRTRRYTKPGTFYHITAKIPEPWFATLEPKDDQDGRLEGEAACEMLMECLRQAKIVHAFKLYAFVIMPNHYHMIIGIPSSATEGAISRILHAIHSPFAHRVNRVLGRRGSVVLERTQTPVIRRPSYLVNAINYVHCNPGRCRGGVDPRGYKYSSLQAIESGGVKGWYRELVDLSPADLELPGFVQVTSLWLRKRLQRRLSEWLGGRDDGFGVSICSVAVGTPEDRLVIDLSLGQRPVSRGRWAFKPGAD